LSGLQVKLRKFELYIPIYILI